MRNGLVLTSLLLLGCDDGHDKHGQIEPEKSITTTFSIATDNTAINQLLPAIRHVLTGLDKYAEQFQEKTVEQNRFLTIKFRIPDNAAIPSEYSAKGHNCFIEINDEHTGMKIPKRACQATLFDRQEALPSSDDWVYFNSADLTHSKDIKTAQDKPEQTEILPSTLDNKPPRPGCLAVYKPDNTTEWRCPINKG